MGPTKKTLYGLGSSKQGRVLWRGGGRVDGCSKGEVLVAHCLWLRRGVGTRYLHRQGMDLNIKAPNACKNHMERWV